MKKQRIYNVLSLLFNFSIVLFTISAVYYSFRTDVIRDEMWFGYTGIHSLRFFTCLSNIFVAIVAVMLVVKSIKNLIDDKYEFPKWLILLKHIASTAVFLTFLTVAVFLAPSFAAAGKGYFTLFENNNLFMHLLTPVLAIVSYVFFERSQQEISFKESFLALVPVSLYAVVYFVMVVLVGEANGGWKDFYNFTFGGHNWAIPISATVVLLVSWGLSLLLRLCHNKYQQHAEKQEK